MSRLLMMIVAVAAAALASPGPARAQASAAPRRKLLSDVQAMRARLERSRPPARDVVADSEHLRTASASLTTGPAGSGDAFERQLARESFAWLTRASALYRWDPAVTPSLMRTYGALCGVYRGWPAAYQPWLWVGYGGANRLARALVLSPSGGRQYERALEEYALQIVALNYLAENTLSYVPAAWDSDQEPAAALRRRSVKPVALPDVDAASLTADERSQWTDVQTRFRTVSARVHQARLLLEDLSERLRRRHLTVNDGDAATAVKMQGFLEDAVDLIRTGQFAMAADALVRADYERVKLKNILGQ